MSEWWTGLSARERVLLLIAACLAAIIGIHQLIYTPLVEEKNQAKRAWQRELANTRETLAGLNRLTQSNAPQQQGPVTTDSLELVLSRSASDRGLDIIRIDSPSDTQKIVWFDRAAPALIAPWLYRLEAEFGLTVVSVDLRPQTGEKVLRGSVTVRRGAET